MKSKFKIATIACFLLAATAASIDQDDDEARVEDDEPQYAIPEPTRGYGYEDHERSRRMLFHNHPLMNVLMKSPSMNYVMKNPNDPFDFLRDTYPLPKGYTGPLQEYDYVIVGAGSAGSVLAARLSETPATVLLLEAGKPEMFFTDVPAIAHYFQSTDYAWEYKTEKQEGVCMGMEGQQCLWPRGRAIGGTSVINYMIYTRGRPQDWDRIAADGNYGWSYNEVLHYYKKSERAKLKDFKNSPYHGYDGELPVEDIPFRTKLSKAFLAGGEELGHRTVDYNSPDGMGFGYVQATIHYGHRCSAAKAFLHPIKKRKNLHILPYARVTKIHIDPSTKEAHTVEYTRNRFRYTVKARREIILSAGPLASPQLLMLSGIGPKEHLEELGIPVIQNLSVGRTLYDHITFPGLVFLVNATISFTEARLLIPEYLEQWLQFGEGPLSTIGGVEGIGYVKTPESDDSENVPDMELISAACSIVSDGGGPFSKGMGIRSDFYNAAYSSINNRDTWTALPMLLHPKSKGYMRLRSANPFDYPKFYGNYLSHPQDVATFVYIINYIIKLSKTKKFQKYGATLHTTPYPNCIEHKFGSDNYWECAVRTVATSLHHQIGTCKMGPLSDPEAVVDPELRVHGIKKLRVVDSGIIPRTISAHTHAPAVMIGEKAADMIKADWENEI